MKNVLTYEYYYNTYCGGHTAQLAPEEFERYIAQAWREVESCLTSDVPENLRERVFSAVCETAELLFRAGTTGRIASESIDGYSVSYREEDGVCSSENIRKTITRRLAGTGLLYAGVEIC